MDKFTTGVFSSLLMPREEMNPARDVIFVKSSNLAKPIGAAKVKGI